MQLCQNPARDWRAWYAESADDPRELSTASLAAGYLDTCRNPTRDVKAWLAASGEAAPAAPPVSDVADDVAKYVRLCQNPAQDWRAWLAEDHQPRNTGGLHDHLESTDRLCRVALHEMQSGLDAIQGGGLGFDYLPARPPADPTEHDGVRPVRSEGRIDLASADSADAEAMQARRFGMLQRFMQAARSTVARLVGFHRGSGGRRGRSTRKGKGRATSGGSAYQLRKAQNRSAKRAAFLRHLVPVARPAKAPPPMTPPTTPAPERPARPQGGATPQREKPQPS